MLRPSAATLVALAFVCRRRPGAQQASFRGRVDLVTMAVTVTDSRGQLVTDLTRDEFEILEDGRPQTLRLFAVGDAEPGETPLHLGLMLDVSESMDRDLPFVRSASIKFLNMLTDAEDVTVVDFDTEVRVARFSQRDFPRLVERIRQQKVVASPRCTTPSACTSTAPARRPAARLCCSIPTVETRGAGWTCRSCWTC